MRRRELAAQLGQLELRDARQVYTTAPFEAWDNAWFNAACAFWPVKGPAKPLQIKGAGLPGILMLQGTLDAATPYAGAQVAHRLLPSARMVVVEGGGNHGQSLSVPPNACVNGYLNRYLATGAAAGRTRGWSTRPARRFPIRPRAAEHGRPARAAKAGGAGRPRSRQCRYAGGVLRTRAWRSSSLRLLSDRDLDEVLGICDRDAVTNVFVSSRVHAAGLDPGRLGAQMWGYWSPGG